MEENKDSKNSKKDNRDRQRILEEVKRLSQKSQETAEGKQSKLFEGENLGEDSEFDTSILNDTVNPQLSHQLYYGIQGLLIDNLPSGKANERLRRYVFDEKNLFINQGKGLDEKGVRGSDGRMAPPETILREAFNMVFEWVASGANPFDIFYTFRQKNEELGYYKNADLMTDTIFDENLKGLLNVPPPKEEK